MLKRCMLYVFLNLAIVAISSGKNLVATGGLSLDMACIQRSRARNTITYYQVPAQNILHCSKECNARMPWTTRRFAMDANSVMPALQRRNHTFIHTILPSRICCIKKSGMRSRPQTNNSEPRSAGVHDMPATQRVRPHLGLQTSKKSGICWIRHLQKRNHPHNAVMYRKTPVAGTCWLASNHPTQPQIRDFVVQGLQRISDHCQKSPSPPSHAVLGLDTTHRQQQLALARSARQAIHSHSTARGDVTAQDTAAARIYLLP
jgi:hypothetical protein